MITQPKFWIGQKVRVRTPEEIGSELWNKVYTKKACNGSPGTSYIITAIEYMRGDYYYKLGEANYHSKAVLDLAPDNVNKYPRIPMGTPIRLPKGGTLLVNYIQLSHSGVQCGVNCSTATIPLKVIIFCNNPIL